MSRATFIPPPPADRRRIDIEDRTPRLSGTHMQLVQHADAVAAPVRRFRLPGFDPVTAHELLVLWDKYAEELAVLSGRMAATYKAMTRAGLGAAFGDLEGELLYVLVRETKPELVFEVSPNSGYSTNYLLAAVTRNGVGRVEGFEIIEAFGGVPTDAVIRGNLIDLCDPARYRLTVGDARATVLRRMEQVTPDFTLLDSCHEDFFAEFYVKALLPYLSGTVVIQDVFHFDPRPHWTSEGLFTVSWLYESGTPFLPFPVYEDTLASAPARAGFAPRRPFRSNSIVLVPGGRAAGGGNGAAGRMLDLLAREAEGAPSSLDPEFPLNATVRAPDLRAGIRGDGGPADRYAAALFGGVLDEEAPGFPDILAVLRGREPTPRMEAALARTFDGFDPLLQVLTVDALTRHGRTETVRAMLRRVAVPCGTDLPRRMAQAAHRMDLRTETLAWIEVCLRAGHDRGLATGHQSLMQVAGLAEALGERHLADRVFAEIRAIRDWRLTTLGEPANAFLLHEIRAFGELLPRFAERT